VQEILANDRNGLTPEDVPALIAEYNETPYFGFPEVRCERESEREVAAGAGGGWGERRR
jgi:hypothetical protein